MKACVIHPKSPLNGRNVDFQTVHQNGLKANGPSAQLHADKMEQDNDKFIAKKSAQMGKPKLTII